MRSLIISGITRWSKAYPIIQFTVVYRINRAFYGLARGMASIVLMVTPLGFSGIIPKTAKVYATIWYTPWRLIMTAIFG